MPPRRAKLAPELERAMESSLRLYANGDKRFFDYFTEDARIYSVESSEPIVGRKAFQASFGPEFSKTKRKVAVLSADAQVIGEQAILSQTLSVSAGSVTTHIRQSVVWQETPKGWAMVHVHNAIVGQPVATSAPKSANAVKVLNERIATVAAVVGVAQ
jgi:hypothetical protein